MSAGANIAICSAASTSSSSLPQRCLSAPRGQHNESVHLFSRFLGHRVVLQNRITRGQVGQNGGTYEWMASRSESAQFAKELERVAAKEALLLAITDAGGIEDLLSRKGEKATRMTVNEKLLAVERLNPTIRPTTSPLLEGLWQLKWTSLQLPGIFFPQLLARGIPPSVVSLNTFTVLINDAEALASVVFKTLNTIENSFALSAKFIAEGPTRLKEEFVEGKLSAPVVPDGNVPTQLKGFYKQLNGSIESLPKSLKNLLTGDLKINLAGRFKRQLLISYLDNEILVFRDETGVPEIFYKEPLVPVIETEVVVVPEYVS